MGFVDAPGAPLKAMRTLFAALLLAAPLLAHVGSPDVYFDGSAGPYPMFVTVRPPKVIPGVADIEIRTPSKDVESIRITPLPLTGEGSQFAPTPDAAKRSPQDPQFFTGSLWIMATGSWQVRVTASGSKGDAVLNVPVPAVATRTRTMDFALGAVLWVMMIVLVVGVVSIVGAGVREAQLEPGAEPPQKNRRRARVFMGVTAALVVAIVYLGNSWWTAEAKAYSNNLYRPLDAAVKVDGSKLTLSLNNTANSVHRRFDDFMAERKVDDFIPDHGHLMHLYVIRWPEMDRVWHLHPEMTASGVFAQNLPAMPAGDYHLYGDVVHSSGFPETIVSEIKTQGIAGTPLEGDDAAGTGPAVVAGAPDTTVSDLGDGWKMVWDRDKTPLKVDLPTLFQFHLEDAQGKRPTDMEFYMGMPGHAAFVKTDGSVFAHVHPSGSIAMPALALANPSSMAGMTMNGMDMPGMKMGAMFRSVSFPYGFPQAGQYRILVQVKRGGRIETGMFDANVAH